MLTKLKKGDKAPNFLRKNLQGHPISFRTLKEKRVLLSLFRGASCPFCNMRVRELILRYPELSQKNIEVIAVFHSTATEILAYAGKQEVPFPIIADPELELYQLYGSRRSFKGKMRTMMNLPKVIRMMGSGFFNFKSISEPDTLPADFLIDKEGRIQLAYYGKDFSDHIALDSIVSKMTHHS